MQESAERFLVTGALGCIGAWTVAELTVEGASVVGLDLGDDDRRLQLLLAPEQRERVELVRADVADQNAVERALDEHGITNVIHLAALQVPFCKADPMLGARVNVLGTIAVFEAVKGRRERMSHVVYASSVATYDDFDGVAPGEPTGAPRTHYGVYKRANEGSAGVYWHDDGIPSIGLRPYVVYGPGRDQGMTAAPTWAMLAAAAGLPYRIPFGGRFQMQHARDVARAFIAASRAQASGARAFNLDGGAVHMSDVVAAIGRAAPGTADAISFDDVRLPFPSAVDASGFAEAVAAPPAASLEEGVQETVERFRRLLEEGRLPQALLDHVRAA